MNLDTIPTKRTYRKRNFEGREDGGPVQNCKHLAKINLIAAEKLIILSYPGHPLFQGLSHVLPTAYNPLSLSVGSSNYHLSIGLWHCC